MRLFLPERGEIAVRQRCCSGERDVIGATTRHRGRRQGSVESRGFAGSKKDGGLGRRGACPSSTR